MRDDAGGVGPHKFHRARRDGLGALGHVPHHEDGLPRDGASSCTPPESVRMTFARRIRATNGT